MKITDITMVALFMALVIIGSRIYIGTHDTFRFHLGNSMCLLAAFLLPPFYAGIASGVGSMIFDIVFYPSGLMCLITLITKFVMAYVTGFSYIHIFKKMFLKRYSISMVLSGSIGELCYIFLYGLKTYIERRLVLSMPLEAVIPILLTKVGASFINAVIAIIISTIVYQVIKRFRFDT